MLLSCCPYAPSPCCPPCPQPCLRTPNALGRGRSELTPCGRWFRRARGVPRHWSGGRGFLQEQTEPQSSRSVAACWVPSSTGGARHCRALSQVFLSACWCGGSSRGFAALGSCSAPCAQGQLVSGVAKRGAEAPEESVLGAGARPWDLKLLLLQHPLQQDRSGHRAESSVPGALRVPVPRRYRH